MSYRFALAIREKCKRRIIGDNSHLFAAFSSFYGQYEARSALMLFLARSEPCFAQPHVCRAVAGDKPCIDYRILSCLETRSRIVRIFGKVQEGTARSHEQILTPSQIEIEMERHRRRQTLGQNLPPHSINQEKPHIFPILPPRLDFALRMSRVIRRQRLMRQGQFDGIFHIAQLSTGSEASPACIAFCTSASDKSTRKVCPIFVSTLTYSASSSGLCFPASIKAAFCAKIQKQQETRGIPRT